MIAKNDKQVRVLNGHELLYNTYKCKELHKINDDLYVIEEDEKVLTMVYCSTLIARFDNLLFYKIIPKHGVFIYEEVLNGPLGVYYNGQMERLMWFMQEEEHLIFAPQGRLNLLLRFYIVKGFEKNQRLVLEDKKGLAGYWDVQGRKFVRSNAEIVQTLNII